MLSSIGNNNQFFRQTQRILFWDVWVSCGAPHFWPFPSDATHNLKVSSHLHIACGWMTFYGYNTSSSIFRLSYILICKGNRIHQTFFRDNFAYDRVPCYYFFLSYRSCFTLLYDDLVYKGYLHLKFKWIKFIVSFQCCGRACNFLVLKLHVVFTKKLVFYAFPGFQFPISIKELTDKI